MSTPASPSAGNECFTDFALQEYLAGRLDPVVRLELEAHLRACKECQAAATSLEAEARILRAALSTARDAAPITDFTNDSLARYLDGALDELSVQALEENLSRTPELLARLIALRAEVVEARTEAEMGSPERKPEPLGEILRMPKRIRPVLTVISEKRTGEAGA